MPRIVLLLVLLSSFPAVAAPPDLSQATALEKKLFADSRDGTLDNYSMMDAAFIASGLPDQEALDLYRSKYRNLLAKARKAAGREETERGKARAIFDLVHRTTLQRYGLHAVDMVGVFSRGDYNCVSATVLYNSLLDDVGLESWGILVPSHAFSVVRVDGQDIEVETTSPKGFDPARTDEAYRELLRQYRLDGDLFRTGRTSSDQHALIREIQGEKKPVGNLTMVAVIYSNMAAARMRDGDIEGTLANFVKASALSSEDPRFQASRDALLNNLVVDLIQTGGFADAAEAAKAARRIPGLSAALLEKLAGLQAHAVTMQASALGEQGKYEAAVARYDEALKDLPDLPMLIHNRMVGYVSWAIALNQAGNFRKAANVNLKALSLYPNESTVRNNYLATVQKYIKSRKAAQDSLHALKIAEHGYRQAAAVYERGGDPEELLYRLQMEIGLVYFAQGDYAQAIDYFVPGLTTGRDIYLANYLAASGNLAQTFLKASKPEEAFTAVSSALRLAGHDAALRHGFYDAYWASALAYMNALEKSGKAATGLQIATSAPTATLDGKRNPVLYRSYWRQRASILGGMGRRDDCHAMVRDLAPSDDPKWLEGLRSLCTDGR